MEKEYDGVCSCFCLPGNSRGRCGRTRTVYLTVSPISLSA
jgi:hypothetical protein